MQENVSLVENNAVLPDIQNDSYVEKEIAIIAAELDQIEDTFTSELNVLKDKIGLEYNGYAQLAMDIGSAMHNMSVMSGNNRTANKLAYVAAAATLVIQGIGAYKKNKAHNEYLDKLMEVKRNIAEGRILAMQTALPRLERSLKTSERMLVRFSSLQLPQELIEEEEKLQLKADQGLRILTLYKTAAFFYKLGNYIQAEAEAWQQGQHTSNTVLPGYSDVYEDISKLLFEPDGLTMFDEFINVTTDTKDDIYGRDLLLVSDPQGVAFIMHNLDYAYINPDNTPLGRMLADNQSVKQYNENVGEVANAISKMDPNPQYLIKEAWLWSAVGLVYVFLTFHTSLILNIIICVLYLIVIWTIRFDFNHRLRLLFYYEAAETLFEGNELIKQEAGYVEQPKRDFRKRKMFEGIFN